MNLVINDPQYNIYTFTVLQYNERCCNEQNFKIIKEILQLEGK